MKRIRFRDGLRGIRTAFAVAIALGVGLLLLGKLAGDDATDLAKLVFASDTASEVSGTEVSPYSGSGPALTGRSARFPNGATDRGSRTNSHSSAALSSAKADFRNDPHFTGGRSSTEQHLANVLESNWPKASTGRDGGDTIDSEDSEVVDPDDPLKKLERNSHISGRVLDQTGMGIAGVGLVATVQQLFANTDGVQVPAQYLQYQSISDVDGRYRFSQIVDGEYRVSTVSNGQHASAQIRVRSGTEFANIVLSGERHIVLRGRVSSTMGEPLWSALVSPLVNGVAGAYTDGQGQYQLTATIPESRGGMGIKVKLSGYREQMILLNDTDLRNHSVNLDFTLEPMASVAMVGGRVVSTERNLPLVGMAVEMRSQELRQLYRSTTGEDGQFLFNGVETGKDYQLLVNGGESYQNFVQEQIDVNPSGLNLSIAMSSTSQSSLYGQISNLGGRAIPGYTLNLRRASPPFNTMPVTSDGGGRFAMHGLAAGQLVFERQAYPQIKISGIELADNADEYVQLILDWGSDELVGVVTDGSGAPVGGSNVTLTWSHIADGMQSWSTRSTTADAQGSFGFKELGPGQHTIIVDATGFNTARLAHDLTADGYDVVVKLEPHSISTGSGS